LATIALNAARSAALSPCSLAWLFATRARNAGKAGPPLPRSSVHEGWANPSHFGESERVTGHLGEHRAVPTFAKYVPVVSAAVTDVTRWAYG
jgi:hypothetical protein